MGITIPLVAAILPICRHATLLCLSGSGGSSFFCCNHLDYDFQTAKLKMLKTQLHRGWNPVVGESANGSAAISSISSAAFVEQRSMRVLEIIGGKGWEGYAMYASICVLSSQSTVLTWGQVPRFFFYNLQIVHLRLQNCFKNLTIRMFKEDFVWTFYAST